MPLRHTAACSGSCANGQPVCSTTTVRSGNAASAAAAASIPSGWTTEVVDQAAVLERAEQGLSGVGVGVEVEAGAGAHATQARRTRLRVELRQDPGGAVPPVDPADDRPRLAGLLGEPGDLGGLGHEMLRRGGHMHVRLDVPAARLGEERRLVVGPTHPVGVGHADGGKRGVGGGEERIPVGAGRIPVVDVGVDDPSWMFHSSLPRDGAISRTARWRRAARRLSRGRARRRPVRR